MSERNNNWWQQAASGKSSGDVKNTSPDPSNYQPPDYPGGPAEKVGGSRGVVVPSANTDGTIDVVDHAHGGPMIVIDNEQSHRPIFLDPRTITNEAVQQAIGNNKLDPTRKNDMGRLGVVAKLGRPLDVVSDEEVTPPYLQSPETRQKLAEKQAQENKPVSEPLNIQPPQQFTQPQYVNGHFAPQTPGGGSVHYQPPNPYTFQYGPQAYPLPNPYPQPALPPVQNLSDLLAQLAAAGIVVGPQTQKTATPQPTAPNPQEAALKIAAAFSSLELGFLAPEPVRPTAQIRINLGPFGGFSTSFHAAFKCASCLVLVYDTRYEGGTQWAPAQTNDPILIQVGREIMTVDNSMNLTFSLGKLDLIVLPFMPAEDMQSPPPNPFDALGTGPRQFGDPERNGDVDNDDLV